MHLNFNKINKLLQTLHNCSLFRNRLTDLSYVKGGLALPGNDFCKTTMLRLMALPETLSAPITVNLERKIRYNKSLNQGILYL